MDANGIEYQDLNVAEDRAAREEMIQQSGSMAVPVIDIDGELMIGFNEAELKKKLGL